MTNDFINFYGRRVGHLSTLIKNLLDNLLPQYSFDDESIKSKDFENYIAGFSQLNLEIGFGSGDFIYQQAVSNPKNLYLGVEVFLNGVGQLLQKLDKNPLLNLKIYNNNIYLILNALPEGLFDNIYILFPDPWHKLRHNKRRIINQNNLTTFYKLLKADGKFYFFTDHLEYAKWGFNQINIHNKFILPSTNIQDFRVCPIDGFSTKYQRKALAQNKDIYYFVCTKN